MSTLLTLVRHGQTSWNVLRRWQGQAPIPLDETGHRQAARLASVLAQDGSVTAVYSSDLSRCRQTAEYIGRALGLEVCYDARFREIHAGLWQGMTFEEVQTFDAENYAARDADRFNVPMPGGENDAVFSRRVLTALSDVLDECRGGHGLIVTHGGPVHIVLRHFELHPEGHLRIANTSRTVLRVADDGAAAELLMLADTSHLPLEEIVPMALTGEADKRI
jgi:broad specificity phosphatase PhoE